MRNTISALAIGAVLWTTGCAQFFNQFSGPFGSAPYCVEFPLVCALGGLAIIGGVIFILNAGGGSAMHYSVVSDRDLKTDITHVHTMENGLKLYAFRYRGDKRGFVGVMAEDLARDPRFGHAVSKGQGGYLRVDYGKLGLPLLEGEIMAAAGEAALARAMKQ